MNSSLQVPSSEHRRGGPACPRCGYLLVPVHAHERPRRRVIYYTCPEPYCDHVEPPPRERPAPYRGEPPAERLRRP